ncbi:MAG: hypothetical protein M1817_001106 [Caeruleum heppii]|nr:MAG: hypothetical protein M1817_001106 [Caeruleum heppii]
MADDREVPGAVIGGGKGAIFIVTQADGNTVFSTVSEGGSTVMDATRALTNPTALATPAVPAVIANPSSNPGVDSILSAPLTATTSQAAATTAPSASPHPSAESNMGGTTLPQDGGAEAGQTGPKMPPPGILFVAIFIPIIVLLTVIFFAVILFRRRRRRRQEVQEAKWPGSEEQAQQVRTEPPTAPRPDTFFIQSNTASGAPLSRSLSTNTAFRPSSQLSPAEEPPPPYWPLPGPTAPATPSTIPPISIPSIVMPNFAAPTAEATIRNPTPPYPEPNILSESNLATINRANDSQSPFADPEPEDDVISEVSSSGRRAISGRSLGPVSMVSDLSSAGRRAISGRSLGPVSMVSDMSDLAARPPSHGRGRQPS